MPPGRVLRAAASLLLAVSLAGCIGGTLVTSSPTIATLDGRLASGVVDLEGNPIDCTWLIDGDGRKIDLVVRGLDARYSPLRLIDVTGRVAAREGDRLRVSYNADAVGDSVCSPGVLIVAESFEVLPSPGHS